VDRTTNVVDMLVVQDGEERRLVPGCKRCSLARARTKQLCTRSRYAGSAPRRGAAIVAVQVRGAVRSRSSAYPLAMFRPRATSSRLCNLMMYRNDPSVICRVFV